MTWFCPSCFAELPETAGACLRCGADFVGSGRDFEAAFVGALRHPCTTGGCWQLASSAGGKPLPPFRLISVAKDSSDPYLAAERVRALVALWLIPI